MVLLTVTFELWCSSFIFVLWHLIGMISRPKIEMLLTVTFELWYFDVIVHLWSFSWICAQQIPNWLSFAYKHPNSGNRSQQSRRKCSLYCDISLTILLYNPFLVLRCARIREQDGDRCAKGEAPAVSSTRSSQHKAAGVLEALVTLDRKWPHPKLAVSSMSEEHGEWYYYNTVTGASQWEHPVDSWCRRVISLSRRRDNTQPAGQNSIIKHWSIVRWGERDSVSWDVRASQSQYFS